MFDELKGSGVPFVAAIHARACGGQRSSPFPIGRNRSATRREGRVDLVPKTKLGLPK